MDVLAAIEKGDLCVDEWREEQRMIFYIDEKIQIAGRVYVRSQQNLYERNV